MSSRIGRYIENKEIRERGGFTGAPLFFRFPRLGSIVPVIPRAKQIMFLGGSGAGKSQHWLGIGLMTIYRLINQKNYKAKIFIALLEDPIDFFEDRLICAVLYEYFKVRIDPLELNSLRENPLTTTNLEIIKKADEIVDDILSYCVIVDNIYNATGIYKWLRTESGKLGEHIWEIRKFEYKKKDGSTYTEDVKVYKEYVPNDPELHNFVVVDNLNNLAEEYDSKLQKTLTVRDAITRWCRDYGRLQIIKHWGWTVINIMQSALESDRKQFDNRGNLILEKVEPNQQSLGENKVVSRDHHLIFGIFPPARFGIEEYEEYDITRLGDAYRALIILKSNFSTTNVKVPLYFDGATSYFKELPPANKLIDQDYTNIMNRKIKIT